VSVAPVRQPLHRRIFTDSPQSASLTPRRRYADHVGIHYVLCSKLRQFAYEELEFFLPQYVAARMTARARRSSLQGAEQTMPPAHQHRQ
jgi:hypothetical protein